MALLTRKEKPSFDDNSILYGPQIPDLYAGEDLDAAAPCYVKGSDGKVYMSNGTAANEAAKLDGFTVMAHKSGEPVVLHGIGTRFGYGSGMTPGADYYIAATKGRLDTATTTGGTVAVARAINATDIRVIRAS